MVTRPVADPKWRARRWLVLSPHPDDETLGAGALIAQVSADGTFAGLAYLTDGSGSHPMENGQTARLIAARKREAATALYRLTGSRKYAPIHLGWTDAAPAAPNTRLYQQSVARLAVFCRRQRVDIIAVTARHEPHCDHSAAASLAYAVQRHCKRALQIAEYCVWAEPIAARPSLYLRTDALPAGRRRHALRAHRSQLTPAFGDGFRLPKSLQTMASSDILTIRRRS